MNDNLTTNMQNNRDTLTEMFGKSVDFYTKKIEILGFSCCICMFENLSSIERLWIMMLDELSSQTKKPKTASELFKRIFSLSAIPIEKTPVTTFDGAVVQLTAGASVILLDGINKAIVMSTQNMQFRSVQEPSAESNIQGSREGFTEPLRVNISLIRRLIRTTNFVCETMTLGKCTKTDIALCYDKTRVPRHILRDVRTRLENAELPVLFDTAYLAPFLQKKGFSFFSGIGYTERPDTAAAKICEGKIVVLANGTPFALIAPYFFFENFESMDDYSSKAYFASFVRVMKYIAFFVAIILPGVFVCIANFTPELFPEQLLYKISAAEQSTPLPLFLETILFIFMLEVVREAGLRMPKSIGHSVSLLAALIVGDAAVNAGIVGTPIVIVAAITAICSFVVPSMYAPVTVLRLLFVAAGGIFGPLGLAVMLTVLLCDICNVDSFGIPYTSLISPFGKGFLRDGIIRSSWKRLNNSDFEIDKLPVGNEAE